MAALEIADNGSPAADTITTDEAAALLGCSERSVRRYIAAGKLPGRRAPAGPGQVAYTTTRRAVTDFRNHRDAQQRHSGAIVDTADTADNARDRRLATIHRDDAPTPNAERQTPNASERQEQLLDLLASRLEAVQAALAHDRAAALEAQLAIAHEKVAALARENGRLQAELAHAQAALAPPAPATGETIAGADPPREGWIVRLLWWRRVT